MTSVIIFQNELGNVSVCTPTGELPIEAVLAKDCPKGAIIVDDSELPQGDDAQFFDAWELGTDGKVGVNLGKAQEITRKRLRAEREPLLAEQDVLFQRALETGADTQAIVAEKQRLRDITKLVDVLTSTSALAQLDCSYVVEEPPVVEEPVVEGA